MAEESIGEAVKLRRRTSSNKAMVLREIAAADEEALRWKRKLEKRRRNREKRHISIALTTEHLRQLEPREFSLPDSFKSLMRMKTTQKLESDSSLIGTSQLLDLINEENSLTENEVGRTDVIINKKRKRLELQNETDIDARLLYSHESKLFCRTRNSDISIWINDGAKFEQVCHSELSRLLVNPVLLCSSEAVRVLDAYLQGLQVKLFSFSFHRGSGATSSRTLDLITESDKITELHCLEVEKNIVIFYNINGLSRGNLLTLMDDRTEAKFLGSMEGEVRKIMYLHGADNMIVSFHDSSLCIWNLNNGKYLRKPILDSPPPSLFTGVFVVSSHLLFVCYEGDSVIKLWIVEDKTFKEKMCFQIGDHSFRNLRLVKVKKHLLTFATSSQIFQLDLNTSILDFENIPSSPCN